MICCFVTNSLAGEDPPHERALVPLQLLTESIRRGDPGRVALTESPEEADLILFAESHADDSESLDAVLRLMETPLYRQWGEKCAVHSGKDFPRPLLPGVYPSLPRRWAGWLGCRGGPYLAPLNPYLEDGHGWDGEISALGTFMGVCPGNRCRMTLLKHAEDPAWRRFRLIDSTAEFIGSLRAADHERHHALKKAFVRNILSGKFSLCPRGSGPSSFRIFESMQLGRAPVIISGAWTPPEGPEWSRCSIHIRERDVPRLPQILAEREDEWEALGRRAREAWLNHFSPEKLGVSVVEAAWSSMQTWAANRPRYHRRASFYTSCPRRIMRFKHQMRFFTCRNR